MVNPLGSSYARLGTRFLLLSGCGFLDVFNRIQFIKKLFAFLTGTTEFRNRSFDFAFVQVMCHFVHLQVEGIMHLTQRCIV